MNTRWLALLVIPLLTACAPDVFVQQDPDATLPGPATFSWDTAAAGALPGQHDPRVDNDIVRRVLKAALAEGLAQRGYREDDSGHAAWLVSFTTGLQRVRRVYAEPAVPPVGYVCGMQTCFVEPWFDTYYADYTVQADENTLLVDLRDAATHRLAWRGILTRDVNLKRDLHSDRLREAMTTLLGKLPGTAGAKAH